MIFDVGRLILIYVDEVLFGDMYMVNVILFCRFVIFLKLLMDNIVVDVYWFFCQLCLVWNNFEIFMGDCSQGLDFDDYMVFQIIVDFVIILGIVFDYFGFLFFENFVMVIINVLFLRVYVFIFD